MRNILLLFLYMLSLSCQNKTGFQSNIEVKIFTGLHEVTLDNNETTYIWILSSNLKYVLYPGGKNNINYESTSQYFVKDGGFYNCVLGNQTSNLAPNHCKISNKTPNYNIIKVDSISDKYFPEDKYQVIILEDNVTKEKLKLKKSI